MAGVIRAEESSSPKSQFLELLRPSVGVNARLSIFAAVYQHPARPSAPELLLMGAAVMAQSRKTAVFNHSSSVFFCQSKKGNHYCQPYGIEPHCLQ